MNKIILIFLSFYLLSCAEKQAAGEKPAEGKVRLTYWSSSNPNEIALAKELVKKWNKKHPDIFVHLQPIPASASSEEVLLAAIAGGTTPDICSNMWPGAMDEFISAGGLVRLDTFPDFWPVMLERVPEDLLHSFRAPDSHYYQIPWKTNPIMLVYNRKIFREAGVQPPLKTYSDYLQAAAKIVRDTDGDGLVDRWMLYRSIKPIWWQRLFDFYPLYIGATGGMTLFEGQRIIFNNPAAVKVMRFLRELYAKGYCPLTEFQGDQFLAGRLATQITGPWMITYIEKYKPAGFDYDIMPLPLPDDYQGVYYTYGDHKNISIFSTTKYPKQAWAFARELISRYADLRLLEICSQVPIRKTLVADSVFAAYFAAHPRMRIFARQAAYTRGVDGIADLKEILDGLTQEYEACVLYGRISPEQAMENAAERARVIMEWNRSR